MAAAARKPAARPSQAVRDRIRAAGLRCTAARVVVLEHLIAARGPKTHAEVSEALEAAGFDRATIYRNLTELTEARLLSRVQLGDRVWRFELARPALAGGKPAAHHPHFVCTACGEVSCLDDVQVAITPAAASRGKPKPRGIRSVTEVLLRGRCDHCG
jgi:Fur family transcriptional regulator, ferric uptake regulator